MKNVGAKSVGDRVRERRLALKLSQPQLAKKAGGITYQAIQQLEAGGGTKHLVAIARALGVSAEWLQDGSGPAPSGKTAPSRAALAEKLKALSPLAIAQGKSAVYAAEDVDLATARRTGLEALALLINSADWEEGMGAFMAKRPPRFE